MEMITTGVHKVGSGYVNAFLIDGDEGLVLVDTGLPNKQGAVAQAVAGIGRQMTDITAIVLTHAHTDHIGSAAAIKRSCEAVVVASSVDSPAIEGDQPLTAPPMMVGPLKLVSNLLPKPDPVMVDHRVSENSPGKMPDDLMVIDTPGHTPGHTSYLLDRNGGVLFVGDAAANRRGTVTKGFPNTGGGPVIDRSIRHLAEFEFEVAVFGHAPPIGKGAASAFRAY